MKLSFGVFLLSALAPSAIHALKECDEDVTNPLCIAENGSCLVNQDGCCDGFACFGYNFFKKCQPPPSCLPEWYDCSSGMGCCDDLVCAETSTGNAECQVQTVDTRLYDPGNSVTEPTLPPTKADEPDNMITLGKSNLEFAGSWGDPHVQTYDGLGFDCQAGGEFILMKSAVTRRQIQARFRFLPGVSGPGWAWSSIKGIVMQDEGPVPKVEISFPFKDTTFTGNSNTVDYGCKMLFFVDGVKREVADGTGSDDVVLEFSGSRINIVYPATGFKVEANVHYADNGCFFDMYGWVPDVDTFLGLWGDADGNPMNDWMDRDGKPLPVPSDINARLRQDGYEYCVKNWCIDERESLFTFTEGVDYQDDIRHCELPFGNTLDQFLKDVSPAIKKACNDEITCIIDTALIGIQQATASNDGRAAAATTATCNNEFGLCTSDANCCAGFQCYSVGFTHQCLAQKPACFDEWNLCQSEADCCSGMSCISESDGPKQCRVIEKCYPEFRTCEMSDDCCDSLECKDMGGGNKQCRAIPTCVPEHETCALGECCEGTKCFQNQYTGMSTCKSTAVCQNQGQQCSEDFACCGGLTCVDDNGMKTCMDLPTCAATWQSCKFVGCCQDQVPQACVVTNGNSQCQPTCAANGGQCSADRKCCNSGYTCQNGTCQPEATCGSAYQSCASSGKCCDNTFSCEVDGVCRPSYGNNYGMCGMLGCSDPKFACEAATKTCKPACGGDYQQCGAKDNCCANSGFECRNGQCQPKQLACGGNWQPCTVANGCCNAGYKCKQNGSAMQCVTW
ncbi:hypothetical protein FisN_2Lh055 [Fistulifera solaris]|uniref:VWFD domain-containing protein n=1 Tax=Fistulifera solaris TaxID=1519565 RepID=A0A1Z5JX40_FISSO|nr:hypothetical protein FisN_2Lh055 [Fistulifera solaris]|eukprot:GAX18422.1 hypothetical protein FisN_2Lh055 [Fistulifera solaris]